MALLASRCNVLSATNGRHAPSRQVPSRQGLTCRASVTAEKASLDLSKMSPIHDRILIKPLDEDEKTAGGILLPKGPPKANSDAHYGQVLAIGEEVELPVKVGDYVAFQKYAMAEVEVKDGAVLFVAQKSIMGTLQ